MPAPQPVRHLRSLLWWVVVICLGVGLQSSLVGSSGHAPIALPDPQAVRTEHEAFIAFVFGKVSANDPAAIQPGVLRAQLQQLKESGAHTVRLGDIRAFLEEGRPLPTKPVLLAFDEARRETVEAVEPILDDLEMSAVAFVGVQDMAGGNIDLVSRRKLGRMVSSGRWEVGIGACRSNDAGNANEQVPKDPHSDDYLRQKALLEDWADKPVLAISCLRRWSTAAEVRAPWLKALKQSSMPLGFVAQLAGVNHRDADPAMLRLIRIPAEERDAASLVRHWATYTPRHARFTDEFDSPQLASGWVAKQQNVNVGGGVLRLAAEAGDAGGTLFLGGTERWKDERIDVELAGLPEGQFWIYGRRNSLNDFVRLGVVDGRVVLQKTGSDGQTRQVAEQALAGGSVRLRLQVIGSRAMGFVDDKPLTDRPAELPATISEGPVSLAVWNDDGNARAVIRRVMIEPLQRQMLVVSAQLSDDDFARLRQQADNLWAVSPRLYEWRKDAAVVQSQVDPALDIFIHHHHLALLPSVTVDELPAGSAWEGFSQSLLQLAERRGHAGINVVLGEIQPDDLPQLERLRVALQARNQTLTITLRQGSLDFVPPPNLVWVLNPGSGASVEVAGDNRRRRAG